MQPANRDEAFAVLDLAPGARPAEIKRAFRRLAMQWHPDRNAGHDAIDRFRQIKAAHDFLVRGEAEVDAMPEASPRGPDQRDTLWLTLEEAIAGGVHVQVVSRAEPCGECAGSGRVTLRYSRLCETCQGSGRVREGKGLGTCAECAGKGFSAVVACEACAGSGARQAERSVRVTVPAGMWPGRMLRLAGKAAQVDGQPPGDLLLVARLQPHELFVLEDDALSVTVPMSLFEMLLGGAVLVPVPGGVERVDLAPGAHSVQRFELPGHGLPQRDGSRGVLHVQIEPVMPESLGKSDLAALDTLQQTLARAESRLFPRLAAWRRRWLGIESGKKGRKGRRRSD
ncbi:MAG: J domain-containing protein [Rhodocyclaceae bacterium]|nr:J domain-containing protein [Rhodocyclaceae bacterium]